MELEPITRQEQIIAGKNLKPITRMEKFLREYGSSGGGVVEIPITWNDHQDDFTVGTTFAEMREAIDSGSTVVLKDDLGSLYYLYFDEGEYLCFTNAITNMNGRMIFSSFEFAIDGSERYYSESVTTQENSSVTHNPSDE